MGTHHALPTNETAYPMMSLWQINYKCWNDFQTTSRLTKQDQDESVNISQTPRVPVLWEHFSREQASTGPINIAWLRFCLPWSLVKFQLYSSMLNKITACWSCWPNAVTNLSLFGSMKSLTVEPVEYFMSNTHLEAKIRLKKCLQLSSRCYACGQSHIATEEPALL